MNRDGLEEERGLRQRNNISSFVRGKKRLLLDEEGRERASEDEDELRFGLTRRTIIKPTTMMTRRRSIFRFVVRRW